MKSPKAVSASANSDFKVTLITGGVGGAKLAEGLAAILPPERLSIIGNIGDDDEFHGLWVSPDIDTLTYTLAGLVNRQTGWGLAGDTFQTLKELTTLGEDTWMQLGDRDLATHIYRTAQRQQGRDPTDIAQAIAKRLGVKHPILLPTSQNVQTRIQTAQGWLSMQEYFVRERCKPKPLAFEYTGSETATANPAALAAIKNADVLIFAPSNPVLSIAPTLAIAEIRQAIQQSQAYRLAVAPLVDGKAIKGPTCAALQTNGYSADLCGITQFYSSLIDALVIDQQDHAQVPLLSRTGLDIHTQNILMSDRKSRIAVARELLQTLSAPLDQPSASLAQRQEATHDSAA
ncbi:2-phospho-L-lactate transferase [Porticoccaceae bacterium]|nr:2-phospho-L-lactate transferase [Porticoccaceae bacterium]